MELPEGEALPWDETLEDGQGGRKPAKEDGSQRPPKAHGATEREAAGREKTGGEKAGREKIGREKTGREAAGKSMSRGGFPGGWRRSDNPDVLYGRDFQEEAIPIEQIQGEMGEVVIRGKIRSLETREIRGEKTIIIFSITDFTDTMMIKLFTKNEYLPDILEGLKKGIFVK